MKKLASLLLVLFAFNSSIQAQENEAIYGDNPDLCNKKLTIMRIYYEQKKLESALPAWRWCINNCPQSSKNIYLIGKKIIKDQIKKHRDNDSLKQKYVDTLLMNYDKQLQFFPEDDKNKFEIIGNKGEALALYRINDSYKEAYNLLDSCVSNNSPDVGYLTATMFIVSSSAMHQKNEAGCDQVIKDYLRTLKIVEGNSKGKRAKYYEKVQDNALKYSNECLDCEILDSLYTAGFEANKNDTNWLDNGIELITFKAKTDKACLKSEVLVSMMEQRFKSAPSSKTAIVLAQYFASKQENSKSLEYYDKGIEMEADTAKLIEYLLKKAKFQIVSGSPSGARVTANKVLALEGGNAEAYYIIGDAFVYGAGSCKDLKFKGAEVFWVAVDYYNRAAANTNDADLKSKANSSAAKYASYFPLERDIFLQNLNNGDDYTVDCWINTTTKIRGKK